MIVKRWIVEHGIGHWVVSKGNISISCDESELNDTIRELEEM